MDTDTIDVTIAKDFLISINGLRKEIGQAPFVMKETTHGPALCYDTEIAQQVFCATNWPEMHVFLRGYLNGVYWTKQRA